MKTKFRAHDTFYIRKGWLSKGMKYINEKPDVFVSKEENPMDVFGIGANMVKALRYWMQAVGLTEEPNNGRRTQTFTPFGRSVFENDRYIEEMGTLQLLHYKLVTNRDNATAWYFFFNKFDLSEFSKEDFVKELNNYVLINGVSVAQRSLEEDFNCIINTYLPRFKSNPEKVSPENNLDCPLSELALVDTISKKKLYKKSIPLTNSFNPWIILAVIMEQAKERTSMPLNELLTGENSIGKVFNLEAISMLEILHNVEKTNEIKIIRTAGLDIIKINNERNFQECVDRYYESINR